MICCSQFDLCLKRSEDTYQFLIYNTLRAIVKLFFSVFSNHDFLIRNLFRLNYVV